MEPVTPSRRGTFDLPKPETGLAEWTSKIKALQRQVDADEEVEQKRLEDEIAASRKARLRRSRGVGYDTDNLDLSRSPGELGSPSIDVFKSSPDKQTDLDDTLNKLTGAAPNVDTSSITRGVLPRQSHFPATQPPPSQRPAPVPLAAFIGGRATGPRLNRHAPQQDAHDPTQFEQRTISAPHPIFGKGGVAMPGMVAKPGGSVREAVRASEAVERYQPRLFKQPSKPSLTKPENESPRPVSPQKSGSRDRTISTPSVTKKYVEAVEQRPVSPQKSGSRERTLSTPTPAPSALQAIHNFGARSTLTRPGNGIPVKETRPKTPTNKESALSSSSRVSAERPFTPRQAPASVSTQPSPAKSSIPSPYLARPILPEPRGQSQPPGIASSLVPSPAFQKNTPTKDPTPSISRLQGRGFVQNMVKASSQLESSAKSTPGFSERPKSASGRKSSVLDRWQPSSASSSPTPSMARQASPTQKPLASDLSVALDTSISKPPTPPSVSTPPAPVKALKPRVSFPTLLHPDPLVPTEPLSPRRAKLAEKMVPPEGSTGFGSATTMVVYKPKTPEKASQPGKVFASALSADELGVRRNSGLGAGQPGFPSPPDLPGPAGKPLNHPTRDRARKPKKSRATSGGAPPQVRSLSEPVKGPQEKAPFLLRPLQPARAPSPEPTDDGALRPSTLENAKSPVIADQVATREPAPKVAHLVQKLGQHAPIGVKPVSSPSIRPHLQTSLSETRSKTDPSLMHRALPGMTSGDNLKTPPVVGKAKSPSPGPALQVTSAYGVADSGRDPSPTATPGYTGSPDSTEGHSKPSSLSRNDKPPRSPSSPKHTRIPSTGNRALVMDVAQALSQHNPNLNNENVKYPPETLEPVADSTIRPKHIVPPSLERRRSSYDRFSAISVMPPLEEEATPYSTPCGTLTRTPDNLSRGATLNRQVGPAVVQDQMHTSAEVRNDVVCLDVDDTPLPHVDVFDLLRSHQTPPLASPDVQTISVDVLAINGSSAVAISRDADVFYDSEILVIVHRYKSKSSGLASTQLWQWRGRKSIVGEREERKLQELAKRYSTSPTIIYQFSEPPQLVYLLGGQLVTRQGNRLHWSAENTAMYLIRKLSDVVYIDENDVNIKNLCSAFSYCLTILDTTYVWHGCGSTDAERKAALHYASRINKNDASIIQLYEDENDNDELFWMALGDEGFAKADYWQWRRHSSVTNPRVWLVDAKASPPVTAVALLRDGGTLQGSIYIVDCIWEYFVLVGSQARGERLSIRLALNTAKGFSKALASSRPFAPTVHVLVLPSRLPMDLRLSLRELDEAEVNNKDIPDHMNLLSLTQSESHLRKYSWEGTTWKDSTMLPLGVSVSDA